MNALQLTHQLFFLWWGSLKDRHISALIKEKKTCVCLQLQALTFLLKKCSSVDGCSFLSLWTVHRYLQQPFFLFFHLHLSARLEDEDERKKKDFSAAGEHSSLQKKVRDPSLQHSHYLFLRTHPLGTPSSQGFTIPILQELLWLTSLWTIGCGGVISYVKM